MGLGPRAPGAACCRGGFDPIAAIPVSVGPCVGWLSWELWRVLKVNRRGLGGVTAPIHHSVAGWVGCVCSAAASSGSGI